MKKKLLLCLIIGVLITNGTACATTKDQSTYNAESKTSENDAKEPSVSATNTPEEVVVPTSLPFTFQDLESNLQQLDTQVTTSKSQESDLYCIQAIKVGEAYDRAATWVYCFSQKDSVDNIIGVKISCAETPNYLMSEHYYDTIQIFLDMLGIEFKNTVENYISQTFEKNGITANLSVSEDSDDMWMDLMVYINPEDFQDPVFSGPVSNFGAMGLSSSTPIVTWNDVVSGTYDGQTVYIDGVVDDFKQSSTGLQFNMFFEHDGIYEIVKMYLNDSAEQYLLTSCPDGIKNGDILRISQVIVNSGTVGQGFITADKIGEISIDDVHVGYKNGCPDMDYESIIRTPVDAAEQKIKCKFTGSIAQVIDEGGQFGTPEYLVESNGNYVYVVYFRAFENRNIRFLEGDNVTVYGNFTIMKTYDTLIGEKTVPQIDTYLIDLT